MDENEREIMELKIRVAQLESELGRPKWWQIAGGIASIVGAVLAGLTLWAVLAQLAEAAQTVS